MSNHELARQVTKHLGGEWKGRFGLAPGPGHSKHDRSLKIKAHPSKPDDIVLHSFAGDDWQPSKDELRAAGILPKWDGMSKPVDLEAAKKRAEEAAKEQAEDEARRRWRANQLWNLRQPIQGTLAEAYLRIGRGFGDFPCHRSTCWDFCRPGWRITKSPIRR